MSEAPSEHSTLREYLEAEEKAVLVGLLLERAEKDEELRERLLEPGPAPAADHPGDQLDASPGRSQVVVAVDAEKIGVAQ